MRGSTGAPADADGDDVEGGGINPVTWIPGVARSLGKLFGKGGGQSAGQRYVQRSLALARAAQQGASYLSRSSNYPDRPVQVDWSTVAAEDRNRVADFLLWNAGRLQQAIDRTPQIPDYARHFGPDYVHPDVLAYAGTPTGQSPGLPPDVAGPTGGGVPAQPPDLWDSARLAVEVMAEWLRRRRESDAQRRAERQWRRWLREILGRGMTPPGGNAPMPYPDTTYGLGFSLPGAEAAGQWASGGGSSWLRDLGVLAGGVGSVIRGIRGGSLEESYNVPYVPDILVPDVLERGMATAGMCGSPFVSAASAAARPSTFAMANPANGRMTWFRPAGKPVLWSSDLGACRRVARIARKAKRRAGGR